MTVSISNLHVSEETTLSPEQLSALLIEARHAAGYSVEDLAVTTGLVSDEIESIENGSDADPAKVKRIALALKVPVSAIRAS